MRFDVVISFAGEDRAIAALINDGLKVAGVSTFYDTDHRSALWGRNLAEDLFYIYSQAGEFCLMLISRHYLDKMWAGHERRAALSRGLRQDKEYILPYLLGDVSLSEVDGLNPDIAYLKASEVGWLEVVDILLDKLGKPPHVAYKSAIRRCCEFVLSEIYRRTSMSGSPPLAPGLRLELNYFCSLRDAFYSANAADHHFLNRWNIFTIAVNTLAEHGLIYPTFTDLAGTWFELTEKGHKICGDGSYAALWDMLSTRPKT